MTYSICQKVTIVDLNDEVIHEVLFEHGQLEAPIFSIGCSVITHKLGLHEFEVVYDKRLSEPVRYRIVDIEFSLVDSPPLTRAYLEPIKLIVGQHDVGNI